jgi:hypothetical protein
MQQQKEKSNDLYIFSAYLSSQMKLEILQKTVMRIVIVTVIIAATIVEISMHPPLEMVI